MTASPIQFVARMRIFTCGADDLVVRGFFEHLPYPCSSVFIRGQIAFSACGGPLWSTTLATLATPRQTPKRQPLCFEAPGSLQLPALQPAAPEKSSASPR